MLASALLTSRVVLSGRGIEKPARSHVGSDIAAGIGWLWRNPAVRTLALTIVGPPGGPGQPDL